MSSHFSATLGSRPRGTLHLQGRNLRRPEIAGGSVTVEVDGHTLGSFTLQPGKPIDERWTLPAELDSRAIVSVVLRSDDWLYADVERQRLAVFRIERLAIEPP